MQGQITLSKIEKRYQFVYLIFMLIAALLFLGIIFLKGFSSPFSSSDVLSLETLDQKAKFNERQKVMQIKVDSTFSMISKLTADVPQPMEENDIKYNINDIQGAFQNINTNDLRKEGYPQIAVFYRMYFEDKKMVSKISENIKEFEKQFDECSVGYRGKQENLIQRRNALNSK